MGQMPLRWTRVVIVGQEGGCGGWVVGRVVVGRVVRWKVWVEGWMVWLVVCVYELSVPVPVAVVLWERWWRARTREVGRALGEKGLLANGGGH